MNVGKPVDLSGIEINELHQWMKSNKHARNAIICQSIIALNEGVQMTEVCKVMGVTRETVRKWKNLLRNGGIKALHKQGKVGKRSKLTKELKSELKRVAAKSPLNQGYKQNEWTGKLIKQYADEKWKIKISIRTAQLWPASLK